MTCPDGFVNPQYVATSVDTTDMVFEAEYSDGNTEVVSPTGLIPTTWGDTVGTQTATFSYTEDEVTVTCDVEANVLADNLDHLSLITDGEPFPLPGQTLYEGSALNATDLERFSVTAVYDSGKEVDVTSEITPVADDTRTDHFGGCLMYRNENWSLNNRGAYRFVYEDKVTKSAARYVEGINGPNTSQTAYELEVAPNNYIAFQFPEDSDYNLDSVIGPVTDDMTGGYLITGADAGDKVFAYFTTTQWANGEGTTPVDAQGLLALVASCGTNMAPNENAPATTDFYYTGETTQDQKLAVLTYALVDGEGEIPLPDVSSLPIHLVLVVGEIDTGKTVDPATGIMATDIKASTAKTYFFDLVAPVTP